VIVRSIFDRTLFVLGRAAAVAAPAGMLIWLLANASVGGASLLNACADFLDPFARFHGPGRRRFFWPSFWAFPPTRSCCLWRS
jgi:hypothetical protein